MSNLQAAVRAFATEAAQPAELCQQVNRILCGNIAEGRFISFFYCTFDNDIGRADLCERRPLPANPGSRRRHRSNAWFPAARSWACFPDASYEQGRVSIGAGDRLVLFTDGITEARQADDTEFGEERLIALAVENRACSAPALQARLAEAVALFTGGTFQDDATLIVLAAE